MELKSVIPLSLYSFLDTHCLSVLNIPPTPPLGEILFFFFFNFIFKLYNIVLVLPNIEMNPPQVYLCSPS